jgi:hypothetical protein
LHENLNPAVICRLSLKFRDILAYSKCRSHELARTIQHCTCHWCSPFNNPQRDGSKEDKFLAKTLHLLQQNKTQDLNSPCLVYYESFYCCYQYMHFMWDMTIWNLFSKYERIVKVWDIQMVAAGPFWTSLAKMADYQFQVPNFHQEANFTACSAKPCKIHSCPILELSVKYTQTRARLLGPSFAETADKMRGQDVNSIQQENKQGTKLVFSPLGGEEFHPQFWICITCTLTAAHILHLIKPC